MQQHQVGLLCIQPPTCGSGNASMDGSKVQHPGLLDQRRLQAALHALGSFDQHGHPVPPSTIARVSRMSHNKPADIQVISVSFRLARLHQLTRRLLVEL
jgi:hypothetical protein